MTHNDNLSGFNFSEQIKHTIAFWGKLKSVSDALYKRIEKNSEVIRDYSILDPKFVDGLRAENEKILKAVRLVEPATKVLQNFVSHFYHTDIKELGSVCTTIDNALRGIQSANSRGPYKRRRDQILEALKKGNTEIAKIIEACGVPMVDKKEYQRVYKELRYLHEKGIIARLNGRGNYRLMNPNVMM